MFTLEQQIFIVQYFFSNRERLGPIWHLESTKVSGLSRHLTNNMFLETGSVLRKKGSRRPTKRSAENIEESEQRIIAEINPRN
jgi:hypothetical protein